MVIEIVEVRGIRGELQAFGRGAVDAEESEQGERRGGATQPLTRQLHYFFPSLPDKRIQSYE